MTNVYTSYFGNMRAISKADPTAMFVAVCGGLPTFYTVGPNTKWLRKVAPRWNWWNEWHEKFAEYPNSAESIAWYTAKYNETVLDKLDKKAVAEEILSFAPNGGNIYLLCYEKFGNFCHRNLLALWLKPELECMEWTQWVKI